MHAIHRKLKNAIQDALPWQRANATPTCEMQYLNRRQWLHQMGFLGASASLSACGLSIDGNPLAANDSSTVVSDCQTSAYPPPHDAFYPAAINPEFQVPDRTTTEAELATTYNNYYEFTVFKNKVCTQVSQFATYPWQLEIGGLVNRPQTLTLDQLVETFPLEERLYRFRCVEAWSMVVPWTGFTLSSLLDLVQPMAEARYVRFVSANDPATMPGVDLLPNYPWPYSEGLRLDEAQNELSLLAVGLYAKPLLTQNGAPLRLMVPWKYGYKNLKSIVRIELTAEQPSTFWNTLVPDEYGFESNVDPNVPHPRWSQATERPLGETGTIPTLQYNGYGSYVAHLYP